MNNHLTENKSATELTHSPYQASKDASLDSFHLASRNLATPGCALLQLQHVYGNRYVQRMVAQRQAEEEDTLQSKAIQRQPEEEEEIQPKAVQRQTEEEDEQPVGQAKFAAEAAVQAKAEAPRNNTGLPDGLKAGVENLSGLSLDGVRVHYNSSRPAEVQALAYTQGSDIHVAPGQEKHLPHEAWHVVQQMQGRVRPTRIMFGMPLNDNQILEQDADLMGTKAVTSLERVAGSDASRTSHHPLQQKSIDSSTIPGNMDTLQHDMTIQCMKKEKDKKKKEKKKEKNSVPYDKFKSAVNVEGSYSWKLTTNDRTIKVWEIAKSGAWDFHLSAITDTTGQNVEKFHFTLRVGTSKGNDAFAWFEIQGHNKKATLANRQDAGNTALFNNINVPGTIVGYVNNINQHATSIFNTTIQFI